jgi:hypothetical protein
VRANADVDLRIIIRKSPLPPATVAALQTWLLENIDALQAALADDALPELVVSQLLLHTTARSIRSLADQAVVPELLRAWTEGAPYVAIFRTLRDRNIKFGAGNATVEDAVALCENGFGYDVAMIAASLADLAEPLGDELHAGLAWVQRRVKYGLAEPAEVEFFEAGFADRIVAAALAERFPEVASRRDVRQVMRSQIEPLAAVLTHFPAYFRSVAQELAQ